LSGRPPASFQAHELTSIGSFEPPPVKMLVLVFGSAVQDTAVAPLVSVADAHWSGMELVVSFVIVTS
jgi:hypothetical protein